MNALNMGNYGDAERIHAAVAHCGQAGSSVACFTTSSASLPDSSDR